MCVILYFHESKSSHHHRHCVQLLFHLGCLLLQPGLKRITEEESAFGASVQDRQVSVNTHMQWWIWTMDSLTCRVATSPLRVMVSAVRALINPRCSFNSFSSLFLPCVSFRTTSSLYRQDSVDIHELNGSDQTGNESRSSTYLLEKVH